MKIQKLLTGLEYNRPITKEQAIREFNQGCVKKMNEIALQCKNKGKDAFEKSTDIEDDFVSRLGRIGNEKLTPEELWEL